MNAGKAVAIILLTLFVFVMPLAVFASNLFMPAVPAFATEGAGLFLYGFILLGIGAVAGGLIGLWVGNTCGGEGAGIQAGAAMGAVVGLIVGLFARDGAAIVLVNLVLYTVYGAGLGWIIGRMVDASIGWD